MLIGNKNKATASISANAPAHILSCKSCTVHHFGSKWCDDFQEKGRCRAVALVSLMSSGRVQITASGDDAKLIETKR